VRLRDEIKKLALFVGEQGVSEPVWRGTGFLVEIPYEGIPNKSFGYFVTASHVAEHVEGREFLIGVNKTAGGVATVQFPQKHRWYRHPDKCTDVAVFPCSPDPNVFDFAVVHIDQFLTPEVVHERALGIGDEVVIVGLFTQHSGVGKLVPLVRFGNLAIFPDEIIANVKVGEGKFGDISAYLIEARSIGGISGSPVMVKETILIRLRDEGDKLTIGPNTLGPGRVMQGEGQGYFLGLAQGHWEINPKDKNRYVWAKPGQDESVNLGIALVVPAYIIREVLFQKVLVEMRKVQEEAAAKSNTGSSSAN
jgi:hypothetical protein